MKNNKNDKEEIEELTDRYNVITPEEVEKLEATQNIEKLDATQEIEKLDATQNIEKLDVTQDIGEIAEKYIANKEEVKEKSDKIIEDENYVSFFQNVESKNEYPDKPTETQSSNYVSFERRVTLIILPVVFFAVMSIVFGILAKTSYDNSRINYESKTSTAYKVCMIQDSFYKEDCQNEGSEYVSSIVNNVKINNIYTNRYSENVNYNYKYSVKAKLVIHNDSADKNLYTKEEVILDETPLQGTGKDININVDSEIDYKKYRKYVQDYLNKYGLNAKGTVEVSMYINDGTREKKVTTVKIPVTGLTFSIEKEDSSENGILKSDLLGDIKSTYMIYAMISLIAILGLILVAIYGIVFFNRVNRNKKETAYQKELNRLLKEYDSVIAESNTNGVKLDNKKECKIKSFLELLDVRDTLEKPIIYEKVNTVKSRFIVEDNDTVYVYTMKESDFEKTK